MHQIRSINKQSVLSIASFAPYAIETTKNHHRQDEQKQTNKPHIIKRITLNILIDSLSSKQKKLEAATRFELVMRVLQTPALPLGYVAIKIKRKPHKNGADYETRTRYLHLGKVALYRVS